MLATLPRRHRCPACNLPLHRHGDRRYRCDGCGKTIRFRQRKRGPKRKKGASKEAAHFYLRGKITVRDAADFLGVSYGTAYERIRRGVQSLAASPNSGAFVWNGTKVTLILDALWLQCAGERWTVYCVLARHVGEPDARIAVLCAGRGSESHMGWKRALLCLSEDILKAAIAVTSDGHAGLQLAARELCAGAIQQRCQFHVLADLRRRLTARAVANDPTTKRCWETARLLFRVDDPALRQKCRKLLMLYAHPSNCLKHTRNAVRWFCRISEQATTAYSIVDGDVPLTTGSAEATCKRLRKLLCQIRPTSPAQIQRALDVFVRLHPTVKCTGIFPVYAMIQAAKSHQNS